MSAGWTVFWDEACDFCAATLAALLVLDRRGVVRPVPLQSDEADVLLASVALEERMKSAHLVSPSGEVLSGGAAVAAFFDLVPGGGAVARAAAAAPGVPDRAYRWIAEHRIALSRGVPGAVKRWGRGRVAARSEPPQRAAPAARW